MKLNGHYAEESPFKIKKYADKLKEIVCLLLGCTRDQLEDDDFKNSEVDPMWFNDYEDVYYTELLKERYTVRDFLQLIGTELFRNKIHPNTWVNALFADYNKPYLMLVLNDY